MNQILFHSLSTIVKILVFFPGVFMLLFKEKYSLKNYTISLCISSTILLISDFVNYNLDFFVIFVLLLFILLFFKKNIFMSDFIRLVVIIPLLEELIFKKSVFLYCESLCIPIYITFCIGLLLFLFAHSFTKTKYVTLFLFYSITFLVYIYTNNIYIPILFHSVYNAIVYINKSKDVMDKYKTY